MSKWKLVGTLFGVLLAFLGACQAPGEVEIPLTLVTTPTAIPTEIEPTPEPPPPKTLVVCLAREPESLYLYSHDYLYGGTNREANSVLQAVYDGPFDLVDYRVEPVILERVPDLSEGEDALLEGVSVLEKEVYLNPETLQPEVLQPGKPFLPPGCEQLSCAQTYQGGEASMQRLVVDFHIKPDLRWSDGEALTASDSVFSFDLDLHPDSPTTKYLVDRTHSYRALEDGLSVRWEGIPGFMDKDYALNFWSPLPEHQLADYTPAQLQAEQLVNRSPLGWGPYVIEEWLEGEHVLLKKNPHYHRASEGLPRFERLIYRFVGQTERSGLQQLLTGECDLVDESLLSYDSFADVVSLQQQGRLDLSWTPGSEIMRLDFNLTPVGDGSAPGLFTDERTRRAIAGCIDRQAMVDELLYGMSVVPQTYLSPLHPEAAIEGVEPIRHDVEGSRSLLDQAGWRDHDGSPETARIASGVPGVGQGTPLSFHYLSTQGGQQQRVAEALQEDLARCGVQLIPEYEQAEAIKAVWPEGEVFGRRFESVGWAWPDWISPLCEMFASREIPSDEEPFGSNASGFSHPEYDRACERILLGPPESPSYVEAVRQTQEVFASQLPAIPLYVKPRVVASREVCGVELHPLTFSTLWNLEEYGLGEECAR